MPIKSIDLLPRSKESKRVKPQNLHFFFFFTRISGNFDILSLIITVVYPVFQPNGAESERS